MTEFHISTQVNVTHLPFCESENVNISKLTKKLRKEKKYEFDGSLSYVLGTTVRIKFYLRLTSVGLPHSCITHQWRS